MEDTVHLPPSSSWANQNVLDLRAAIDYFFVEIVPLAAGSAHLPRHTLTDLMTWAESVQQIALHPRIAPALAAAQPAYSFPPQQAVYSLGLVFLDNVRLSSSQCRWVETRLGKALGTPLSDRIAFRVAFRQRKRAKRAILRAAYLHPNTRVKLRAQDILQGRRTDLGIDLLVEASSDPLYPLMLQDHMPQVLDSFQDRPQRELNRSLAANPTLLSECVNFFRDPRHQDHPLFARLVIASDLFRDRFQSSPHKD